MTTSTSNDISPTWIDVGSAEGREAQGFVDFVNAAPTPYHAVSQASKMLEAEGYTRLHERESWKNALERKGKYYVTRNQSSLIAFALGDGYQPGNGFSIVGTHTDSCCFKVRPISKRNDNGYVRVGVETYGGGLWHTWLDRDLGLAGRVVVANSDGYSYSHHLVHIAKPLARIPTVAIHLDRTQNEKTFYNQETQMVPILSLLTAAMNEPSASSNGNGKSESETHSPILLAILKDHLNLDSISQIEDFDLSFFDVQPSTIGGAMNEFIFSARIDNLFSTYCAIRAAASIKDQDLVNSKTTRLICLFDHEEIGSVSAVGAESNFLESVIGRVTTALHSEAAEEEVVHRSIANSYLLSCDMGHALHPSFLEKHEVNHRPMMNRGPAIKTNAKQRYATSAESAFLLKRIAKKVSVPLQEYEIRNDMPCGSTIGPLISKIGLRTVDIGCAQLSMHSIRETAGTKDVAYLIELMKGLFDHFEIVDASMHWD